MKRDLILKNGFIEVAVLSNNVVSATLKKIVKMNSLGWNEIHENFKRVAGKNYEYEVFASSEKYEKLFWDAYYTDGRSI